MRRLLLALFLMMLSLNVWAIGVDKDRLADPAEEARAQQIMKKLRCLVCQNQSIIDSDAGLAGDLRGIVREQVRTGRSEREILAFMTDRYGDWVLLKPPVKPSTAILWFGPLLLLAVGGFLVFRFVARRPSRLTPAPLTKAEEARLKRIMGDKDK